MRRVKPFDPSIFGGNFIEEVTPKYRGKRKDRQIKLRCFVCSNTFITGLTNAVRVRQKTCSNQCAGVYRRKSEGGNENHPLYSRWLSMRDRCRNPNNDRYPRYGGRGIMLDPYFDDFTCYIEYIMSLPNAPHDLKETGLQIDRVDNDLGYHKGNLRWADLCTQAVNRAFDKSPAHSSKYVGVHYCGTNKRWIAKVQAQGEIVHQSSHATEDEAHIARTAFIQLNALPHRY